MGEPQMTAQTVAVLNVMLAEAEREWYGLELSSCAGLKPGTIYPHLDQLLRAGWVSRRWEDVDPLAEERPKRRLYRLSSDGAPKARRALDEHLASLHPASSTSAATGWAGGGSRRPRPCSALLVDPIADYAALR